MALKSLMFTVCSTTYKCVKYKRILNNLLSAFLKRYNIIYFSADGTPTKFKISYRHIGIRILYACSMNLFHFDYILLSFFLLHFLWNTFVLLFKYIIISSENTSHCRFVRIYHYKILKMIDKNSTQPSYITYLNSIIKRITQNVISLNNEKNTNTMLRLSKFDFVYSILDMCLTLISYCSSS